VHNGANLEDFQKAIDAVFHEYPEDERELLKQCDLEKLFRLICETPYKYINDTMTKFQAASDNEVKQGSLMVAIANFVSQRIKEGKTDFGNLEEVLVSEAGFGYSEAVKKNIQDLSKVVEQAKKAKPAGGKAAGGPKSGTSSRLGSYNQEIEVGTSPIPGEEMRKSYLHTTLKRLAKKFPAQAKALEERITHYYFGEHMPSAAGIFELGNNIFFFIEENTRKLLDSLPAGDDCSMELIIYLLTVHESTELLVRNENDTITPDINAEVVAFLHKAKAYLDLIAIEGNRALLREDLEYMDKHEPDIEDRFLPVLDFVESIEDTIPDNLADIDDATLDKIEGFIKRDPDYKDVTIDKAAVREYLKSISQQNQLLFEQAEAERIQTESDSNERDFVSHVNDLLDLVKDKTVDLSVRCSAVRALAHVKVKKESKRKLIGAHWDSMGLMTEDQEERMKKTYPPKLRIAAAEAFQIMYPEGERPIRVLEGMCLAEEDVSVRLEAVETLERIDPGNKVALETLMKVYSEGNVSLVNGVRALLNVGEVGKGDLSAIEFLYKKLSWDYHEDYKAGLVKAFGIVYSGNLILETQARYKDVINLYRKYQYSRLKRKGIKKLVSLIKGKKYFNENLWNAAIDTLGKIGSESRFAKRTLRKLLRTNNRRQRQLAAKALTRIDPWDHNARHTLVTILEGQKKEDDDTSDFVRTLRGESLDIMSGLPSKTPYSGDKVMSTLVQLERSFARTILEDEERDPRLRIKAARVIARTHSELVMDKLEKMLDTSPAALRRLLAASGVSVRSRGPLKGPLDYSSPLDAAILLTKLFPGHEKAIDCLRETAGNEKVYFTQKIKAAEALYEQVPGDKAAVEVIAQIGMNSKANGPYRVKAFEAMARVCEIEVPAEIPVVSSRLGAKNKKQDKGTSPIPDEEMEEFYMNYARTTLARTHPAQAKVLEERITHYYFADHMPSAAGVCKLADNTFFFIDNDTRELFSMLPDELEGIVDMILYLLSIHEGTELLLRAEDDTVTPDINTEITAFLYKAQTYLSLTSDGEMKRKLRQAAEIMDREEPDEEDRFLPVFDMAEALGLDMYLELSQISDEVLFKAAEFIKQDPEYEGQELDIAIIRGYINYIEAANGKTEDLRNDRVLDIIDDLDRFLEKNNPGSLGFGPDREDMVKIVEAMRAGNWDAIEIPEYENMDKAQIPRINDAIRNEYQAPGRSLNRIIKLEIWRGVIDPDNAWIKDSLLLRGSQY